MSWSLSPVEVGQLLRLLRSSHWVATTIDVLDLDHKFQGSLSSSFLSGSVNVDATAEVTRSMSAEFFESRMNVPIVPRSPSMGAAYQKRMLQATYHVWDRNHRFSFPVFTGPIDKVDRDGEILKIECQGKEILSSGAIWSSKDYPSGWNKSSLIQDILTTMSGEAFYDIEPTDQITAEKTVLDRENSTVWSTVKSLAESMGKTAFYNGSGRLQIRSLPGSPALTVDPTYALGDPQDSYSSESTANAVEVTGATPRGSKKPLVAKVFAPDEHPLSAKNLGRNGVPRFLPIIEQNQDLKTQAAVENRADSLLREALLQSIDVAIPLIPIPGIDERDLIRFEFPDFSADVRVKQYTFPLLVGEVMSFGYLQASEVTEMSVRKQ